MNTLAVEYAGLLRGVLECPADDGVRLILADWHEEQGHEMRAEFIRLQIDLACLGRGGPDHAREQRAELKRRIHDIMMGPRLLERWWCPYGPGDRVHVLKWRRGFVHSISMTTLSFLQYAAEIFALQPIEAVTLSDKRVFQWQDERHLARVPVGRFCWWRQQHPPRQDSLGECSLPTVLFKELRGKADPTDAADCSRNYTTAKEALYDLSRACVAHGRRQAGLPAKEPSC